MSLSRPLIYADMNIFRYIACNDMQIVNPAEFTWVYSYVHLDEIARNGNRDALDGMKALQAQEISDVLDVNFRSVEAIHLDDYIDPHSRFHGHLEAISPYGQKTDFIEDFLARLFGADNWEKLLEAPSRLINLTKELTQYQSEAERRQLLESAEKTASVLQKAINEHLQQIPALDNVRKELGLTSSKRKEAEQSSNPIEKLWEFVQPHIQAQTKEQFLCLEPRLELPDFYQAQHLRISSTHTLMNLLGLFPDKNLSKRGKLENILSDGRHLGFASYCDAFISSDTALCNKAKAIYQLHGIATNVIHVDQKNCETVELGFL